MNKFQSHIKRNKKAYITGGVCLLAGLTVGYLAKSSTAPLVDNKIQQILNWKPQATLEVYIEALGDPGNIVQDVATGTIYASQNQAAKALGLNASRLSQHLSGKVDNVDGHVFTKLGKAMVSQ